MAVLDLETIDHINKVYFGLKPNTNNFVSASDLKSGLSHSCIQDNIINCFLMNNTKIDIASFYATFFTDIKSQRFSKEVIHRFNYDSYISKRVIFIPVHKNHNHWLVVCIFPLSKVILAVDSLNGSNISDISIVINFFQKYLKYHHLEMSPVIWRVAEHVGYKEQGSTVDCGVYMLLNIYRIINEQLAIGSLENIETLRYWIAVEALNAKNESILIHKEVLNKSVVGNMKNILMSKTERIELKTLEHEKKAGICRNIWCHR